MFFLVCSCKVTQERDLAQHILSEEYEKYRQGIDETSDSLICIAQSYFERHGSSSEKMMSHFLYGRVLFNGKDYGTSMLHYALALEYGRACDDHFMLGQIYTNMYILCHEAFDADAVDYALKAREEYLLSGELLYIIDSEANVGIAFYKNRDFEKGKDHLLRALQIAEQHQDTFSIQKCIRFLAYLNNEKGDYETSRQYFRRLFDDYHASLFTEDLAIRSELYAEQNQFDSALNCLSKIENIDFGYDVSRLQYLKSSAKVHAMRLDYEKAFQFEQEYQLVRDSVYWQRLRNSVMKEQRDFVQIKLTSTEKKNDYLWYSVTCLTLLALVGWLIGLIGSMKRKQTQERLRHAEEKLELQRENARNTLRMIKQSSVYCRIQEKLSIRQRLSLSEWRELNNLYCENLPAFENELRARCKSLKEEEWEMCMLQKLDFNTSDVDILVGIDSSVTSHRLARRHLGHEAGAAEWKAFLREL